MDEFVTWGLRGEIVEHRVLVRWTMTRRDGSTYTGLSDPCDYLAQVRGILAMASHIALIAGFYNTLVETTPFSLDDIDRMCTAMLAKGLSDVPMLELLPEAVSAD